MKLVHNITELHINFVLIVESYTSTDFNLD